MTDTTSVIISMQEKLNALQLERAWMRYHSQLTAESRALWTAWGVSEWWQDFWCLGYEPDYLIRAAGNDWRTPTMTIPIWEPLSGKVVNIKHRLMKPPSEGDKYRFHRRHLPTPAWVANPNLDLSGPTIVVEGEKKAMVVFSTLDDWDYQVVGLPGKDASDNIVRDLRSAGSGPVWIILDPGASNESIALAKKVERGARVVTWMNEKIDDLILANRLDAGWMRKVLFGAKDV